VNDATARSSSNAQAVGATLGFVDGARFGDDDADGSERVARARPGRRDALHDRDGRVVLHLPAQRTGDD
jgi:hypothetical protein